MAKICFLGAGSTIFAKNVLGDCLNVPCLRDAEINLIDIDEGRLQFSESTETLLGRFRRVDVTLRGGSANLAAPARNQTRLKAGVG